MYRCTALYHGNSARRLPDPRECTSGSANTTTTTDDGERGAYYSRLSAHIKNEIASDRVEGGGRDGGIDYSLYTEFRLFPSFFDGSIPPIRLL